MRQVVSTCRVATDQACSYRCRWRIESDVLQVVVCVSWVDHKDEPALSPDSKQNQQFSW